MATKSKSPKSTADVIATLRHVNKKLDPVAKLAEEAAAEMAGRRNWHDMEPSLRDIQGLAAGIELIADGITTQYEASAVSSVGAAIFEKAKLLRHIFYSACGDHKHAAEYLPPEEGGAS